jgi:excinuclease UvrABC nuclease subunit
MFSPDTIDLKALPWLPLDEKASFPKRPVIYFAIDSLSQIQYIGRSVNCRQRWSDHHRYQDLTDIGNIRIHFLFIDSPELLDKIEYALIEWFNPSLNIQLKHLHFESKKSDNEVERSRIQKAFRLDEIVVDGLGELAKRKNSSANRLLENTLFELLIKEGIISKDVEPLGETRGGDQKSEKSKDVK